MSFEDNISLLTTRMPKLLGHLHTEEATKNALVMPFIAALGYDVFNPSEVIPEFTADVGTKKGEKVDYAIVQDGDPAILIECKKAGTDLSQTNMSQLYRYFSVTKARIAILTNGVQYRLFSDLEEPNKMDNRPFLELDLTDPRTSVLAEFRKLAKENFDLDQMLSSANALKYTSEIKKLLASQIENPEEEIVRFFFGRTNPGGRFTASAKEEFTILVGRAFREFISERVNDRLRSALQTERGQADQEAEAVAEDASEEETVKDGIVTTEEELEGFRIVRAIACQVVPPDRVVHRDTKTYMGILLDDNNRKPICRLWFNTRQKYIGVFDVSKNETRIPIDELSDIYKHAEQLLQTLRNYEATNQPQE